MGDKVTGQDAVQESQVFSAWETPLKSSLDTWPMPLQWRVLEISAFCAIPLFSSLMNNAGSVSVSGRNDEPVGTTPTGTAWLQDIVFGKGNGYWARHYTDGGLDANGGQDHSTGIVTGNPEDVSDLRITSDGGTLVSLTDTYAEITGWSWINNKFDRRSDPVDLGTLASELTDIVDGITFNPLWFESVNLDTIPLEYQISRYPGYSYDGTHYDGATYLTSYQGGAAPYSGYNTDHGGLPGAMLFIKGGSSSGDNQATRMWIKNYVPCAYTIFNRAVAFKSDGAWGIAPNPDTPSTGFWSLYTVIEQGDLALGQIKEIPRPTVANGDIVGGVYVVAWSDASILFGETLEQYIAANDPSGVILDHF